MLPIPPDLVKELLVRNSDAVIAKAMQQYMINGFAYVFEVGQSEPFFCFAINTDDNGPANPSTGEWDFPAGFDGAQISAEWQACYAQLSAYMEDDDANETRLMEIHAILRDAMKTTRERWLGRLGNYLFTVNECNDSDEVVRTTALEINRT